MLTEALADLQEMKEGGEERVNLCPEGAGCGADCEGRGAAGPGSAEVVTALRFCMSGLYKISHGEAGELAWDDIHLRGK